MGKYSSFWDSLDVYNSKEASSGSRDALQLSKYQSAISNFVNILTNRRDITVKFNGDNSYTDGQSITIGGNVNDRNFDPIVGLALHEASHCLLTDFKVLKNLVNLSYTTNKWPTISDRDITRIKDILNVIEDRRIDYYIFKNSPGYRGYYDSLYDKYFNSKTITKALKLKVKCDGNSFDDYMFHIINFTNPNRDLDTLPALRQIWELIDIKNISRIENTEQSLDLAFQVYELITKSISENSNQNSEQSEQGNEISGSSDADGEGKESDDSNDDQNGGQSDLSDRELEKLKSDIKKQKDFLDGAIKKTKLNKGLAKDVKNIINSDIHSTEVFNMDTDEYRDPFSPLPKNLPCTVIKKFNESTIETSIFKDGFGKSDMKLYKIRNEYGELETFDIIQSGLQLGTRLGKLIQVRNESRDTTYNRQHKGRLDKRMISALGYDYESVFSTTHIEKFTDAFMHISVDASGSMSGTKWAKTQIAVIAMAKAASMVKNLDVVISYRSTHRGGSSGWANVTPLVLIAYDSRVDNLSKIKKLFPYIYCEGATPEGLCFEAIQDLILESNQNRDSYFINFSDGAPHIYCNKFEYSGKIAVKHTKSEIDKMRKKGVKVLSYFITGRYSGGLTTFNEMYGKSAEFVDVSQITKLAKSINKMFITK